MYRIVGRVIALAAATCTLASAPLQAADLPLIGVNVHSFNSPEQHNRDFGLMQSMGFNTVRVEALWTQAETTKGVLTLPPAWNTFINRAVAANIQPVVILDYGNPFYDNGNKPISDAAIQGYVNYAKFVVTQFRGRVKYYEVWNEWDSTLGNTTNGTPATYAKLVAAVVPAIKAIDPSIVVLIGGGTMGSVRDGWLSKIAAQGAFSPSVGADGAVVHAYLYNRPLSGDWGYTTPEQYAVWISQVHDKLRAATGTSINFYITETGWPTYSGNGGVSEAAQKEYFQRTLYLTASLPFIKGLWWYDLMDDGTSATNVEHHFGLTAYGGTPKAVTPIVSNTINFVRNNTIRRHTPIGGEQTTVILDAVQSNEHRSAVAWSTTSPVSVCAASSTC
jgi:hypothetical protein